MKKNSSFLLLLFVMLAVDVMALQMPVKSNTWKHALRKNPLEMRKAQKRVVDKGDLQLGPVSSYGTLNGPDGKEWLYTATFEKDAVKGYTAAHLKIYDSANKLVGTIDDKFELAEHQTTINQVQIDPNVTQKFFNIDEKYEVILFIHATTDDYNGYCYQHVFSLAENQTEPLMTIPGYEVITKNMASDEWGEKIQMLVLREEFKNEDDNFKYYLHYDVYEHASWDSMNAPVLLHTFSFDYDNLAGSGSNATPITMQNVGGKAHYALSYYEKPFYDPSIPVWEEPVVTPDNNFIIELYTASDFNTPYKKIVIPMETESGYVYTFPGIGAFLGNDDFSVNAFGSDPHFVISFDNYVSASDDFVTSIYIYDQEGNRVATVAEGVKDYMQMSNVEGASMQFCMTDDNTSKFKFVNFPSCETVAEIPYSYEGRMLSTSIDRVPAAGGYNYVISGSAADVDSEDNVLHPIAYFNADGSFNHWDIINLGNEVIMAQPAIISSWLNPYLFDTDDEVDYMFLVKLPAHNPLNPSQNQERFWIIDTNGEKLADFGPNDDMGELNSITILNPESNKPVMATVYYDWHTQSYVINVNNLPLNGFNNGTGTVVDPYLISSAGELKLISVNPAAHYALAADIDCSAYPFTGLNVDFTGSLDGRNHSIKNLVISGNSLIGNLYGTGVIKNLKLESPVLNPQDDNAGIIASYARYDGANVPSIQNVQIINPKVASDSYDGTFGSIIGYVTTGTTVSGCSVAGANIQLPKAVAGGIIGEVNPSGATVEAVAFSGKLNARIAAGIVGKVSAISLQNAHVNADITGSEMAAGIVAELGEFRYKRGTFRNCYVEGSLTSTNATDPCTGGIAGYVSEGDNTCLLNNVVALTAINYLADAEKKTAHRIAGHTSADELGAILWEDPWWDTFQGDPYDHPELWPREEVKPDAGFSANYALAILAPVNADETMAKNPSSVEGKTIEENELTQEFLATNGFLFGESADKPWMMQDGKLTLWFEQEYALSNIHTAVTTTRPSITLAAGTLQAEGGIDIYTATGIKVATSAGTFSTSLLKPGMYIATSNGKSIKFIVK